MSGVGWRGSISSTSSSSAGSIMPSSSRPSTSPSPTNVPFVRSFRFSSQHDDRHHGLLTRKRTSSLPHDDTPPASDPFTAHPADSTSFVTYDAPPSVLATAFCCHSACPVPNLRRSPTFTYAFPILGSDRNFCPAPDRR
ncbi:hypothetical protein A0H81_11081 [Grifola frondosa]|uniref:Uncharacterized protein n=1 Tax=Grifola frondosa TaxID=5627 RepID=A0A1C7LY84_GRIFR|nr:hypothetical protein A0H81_11081 [Grifola frondosa]